MKKNWFSIFLVFVLMGAFASQALAADEGTGIPVAQGSNESRPIMGQHQYGLLEAYYQGGNYDVYVTLQELRGESWINKYKIIATPSNPEARIHYYLEGGKQYRVAVTTQGSGYGYLYNYIP